MAKDAGGQTLNDRTVPVGRVKSIADILDTMQTQLDTATAADSAFGALADGSIIVGNGSGVATDVATEQFFESRVGRMSSRLAGFTVS